MIFGPLVTSPGSTLGKRNITATMTTTKDDLHTYTGTASVTAGPASQLHSIALFSDYKQTIPVASFLEETAAAAAAGAVHRRAHEDDCGAIDEMLVRVVHVGRPAPRALLRRDQPADDRLVVRHGNPRPPTCRRALLRAPAVRVSTVLRG